MSVSRGMPAPEAARQAAMRMPSMETAAQIRSYAPQREGQQRVEHPVRADDAKANARLKEGQSQAQELRDQEAKEPDPRRTMERAREMPSLNENDHRNLERVNPALAREARNFDTYTSVVNEANTSGKTVEQVLRERNIDQNDFNAMRTDVLTRIGNMNYVRQVIPGLDQLEPSVREAFVENYIAANPDVRRHYVETMRSVGERAAAIPDAPQDAALARINGALGLREGTNGATAALTRAQIDAAAATGEPGRATLAVYDQLLRNNNIAEPALFREHFQLQREINDIRAANPQDSRLAGLDLRLKLIDQSMQFAQHEAEYNALNARLTAQVYGEVNPAGVRVNGIEQEIQTLVKQAEAQRNGAGSENPAQPGQMTEAARQTQMEKLSREMSGALESAIDRTLRESYDDATDLGERKVLAEADRLEKEGQERLADAERLLVKREDADWVGKDKARRKRVVHRDQIGADVRRVAYEGDEGVRRIMLRQMSTGEGAVIHLTADGKPGGPPLQDMGPDGKTPQKNPDGSPKPATWETVQMSQLSEADRNLFNQLYDRQHVQFEDRLLRDFDFARHPRGLADTLDLIGSAGSLHLTKDEYGFLHEQFGDRMEKAAADSEAMRGITQELKNKGLEPGGLMALLFALMALFKKKEY